MTTLGPAFAAGTGRSALGRAWLLAKAKAALGILVAVWVFSGAFVFIEPSPYELTFLIAFGVALFGRLRLHRGTLPLLYVVLLFTPFGLIAAFQGKHLDLSDALIFNVVTIFLLITSYFAANYIAQAPHPHMRLIVRAYTAGAVITSVVGILAYLSLLPGEGIFLLYGRAKAFFKDPNVYGPFLILPAMFALQKILMGGRREMIWGTAVYLILFVGVFVSFSRGAWGHLAASSVLVFFLCFVLEATARDKVRLMLLAVGGIMMLAAALMVLLSIPAVSELFVHRFALTQSYDTGETGRFGRIGYALDLALTHPWGLGPLEFSFLRISEQPHNTYINVILTYGWGGALAFYVLVAWTVMRGTTLLAIPSPNRVLLIPAFATFIPMILLSAIIDTDHWRHWFLVTGIVWGACAGYRTLTDAQRAGARPLV